MAPDFVIRVKCIIFWHNKGLRVYFDLYAANFLKSRKKSTLFNLQIKINPSPNTEPKCGAFYSNNKVRVHTLCLVLWLQKVLMSESTFFEKSAAYKSKYSLKPPLCRNMKHLLYIIYNIFAFLMVLARNKMYKGASKKLKMLYIIWLNVVGAIHFITVAKSKMYCMGVTRMASRLTFLHQSNTFYSLPIDFTFCDCNKMISIYNI